MDMHIVTKDMKICSTSLVRRKIKVKTTVKIHLQYSPEWKKLKSIKKPQSW